MVASLIAAGMIGALAVLLAELTRQQNIVQKKTETYFEVNSLFGLMVRTLYDGEACNQTLVIGDPISDGRTIASIKNRDGGVVINTIDKYGNGLLKVESMTLKNSDIRGTSGTVDFEVVIKKLSKGLKGYDKVTKLLPLSVEVGSGGSNLVKCHHTTDHLSTIVRDMLEPQATTYIDNKVEAVRSQFCTGFGGTYDATTKTCSFPAPSTPSSPPPTPVADTIPGTYSSRLGSNLAYYDPLNPGSRSLYYYCNNLNTHTLYLTSCPTVYPYDSTVWSSIRYDTTNVACYSDEGPIRRFTSTVSCADARGAVLTSLDPNFLTVTPSTIEPLRGYQAILVCDPCYILSEGRYTVRCQVVRRTHTIECS